MAGERVDPVVRAGAFEHVVDPPGSSGGTFTVDGDEIDHLPQKTNARRAAPLPRHLRRRC
jgi:hypothetical protein